MTSLLVFLKIIAYIVSIPLVAFLTALAYVVIYSNKLMIVDKRTKHNSLGYITGKLGLSMTNREFENEDQRRQYIDGYNEARCRGV